MVWSSRRVSRRARRCEEESWSGLMEERQAHLDVSFMSYPLSILFSFGAKGRPMATLSSHQLMRISSHKLRTVSPCICLCWHTHMMRRACWRCSGSCWSVRGRRRGLFRSVCERPKGEKTKWVAHGSVDRDRLQGSATNNMVSCWCLTASSYSWTTQKIRKPA